MSAPTVPVITDSTRFVVIGEDGTRQMMYWSQMKSAVSGGGGTADLGDYFRISQTTGLPQFFCQETSKFHSVTIAMVGGSPALAIAETGED